MRRCTLIAGMLISIFIAGCAQKGPEPPSQAEALLRGEHKLRKMAERVDVKSNISASFFLFVGDLSATTQTNISVKFAWEMNDGTYALSSLPLTKIRVKLDERVEAPTIKFRWRPYKCCNTAQVQGLMDSYVVYALVTVRERDWPVNINLPLNKQ